MSNGFNVAVTEDIGLLALGINPNLPKHMRGLYGLCATINEGPLPGTKTNFATIFAEPGNALFWQHDHSKTPAPRGAWGSWSFCVPAIKTQQQTLQYRALHSRLRADEDWKEEPIAEGSLIGDRSSYGLQPPKGAVAAVMSSTGHDWREKISVLSGGPIIIHHRGANPPINSRWGFDIGGDQMDLMTGAGMHTLFWIRGWLDQFCLNDDKSTGTNKPNKKFSWMINATKSTGDFSGYAMFTFTSKDSAASHEAFGPLRPTTSLHKLGTSHEGREIGAMALDCNSFWTFGNIPFDGPLPFEEKIHPITQDGEFPFQVYLWWNPRKKHPFLCHEVDGRWEMHVRLPVAETPPCYKSRPANVTLDANANPLQLFATGPDLYSAGRFTGYGQLHIPLPNLLLGRPSGYYTRYVGSP